MKKMEYVNTTKTKRFKDALEALVGEVQSIIHIEDGWRGHDILQARIKQIECHMAYLPEIFREGDIDDEQELDSL